MAFRGGRGAPRGGSSSFRGARGGRGGAGGSFRSFDQGPPEHVEELGVMLHVCEADLAPVFLENKEQIGKVDDIFGKLLERYFTIKLSDNMKATSFKPTQKFFIDSAKMLPLSRFLPTTGRLRVFCLLPTDL